MNAPPTATDTGHRGLLPALLLPLGALALFEAALATSPARLAFLLVAALVGLGVLLATRERRVEAAWTGVVACFVVPHYGAWSRDVQVGTAEQAVWWALGLAVAGLAFPRRVLAAIGTVQLLLLAAGLLAASGHPSADPRQVLAFGGCATVLAIVAAWHAHREEGSRPGEPERAEKPSRVGAAREVSEPEEETSAAADADTSFRGLRALVLESGAGEREAIGRHLRSLGLDPTLVAQTEAAVKELHRASEEGRPYAVALFDPSLRGSAAFRARRKEDDPVLAATPKVRLWALSSLATVAHDTGPRVLKPATRADLLTAIQQALRGEAPASTVPASAGEGGVRVLVVDDNPVSALVTSRLVALAGGEAVVASRPDAVEDALATTAVAVVVLDAKRPEHRSLERRLRESHPALGIVHAPAGEAALRAALKQLPRVPPADTRADLPLDRSRLVRNLGDDEEAADQVLSAFVAQAGDSLDALRRASVSGDLPSLARAAHRLKGSLLWIGSDRAARETESVETRASAGDADGARAALGVVEDEVRAIVAAIRNAPPS